MERRALTCLKVGILLDFVNINIGNLDLLPDFVGMLLLYASIQCHRGLTQAEQKVKPLFLILAADYFLHWIISLENSLESLLVMVIYIYAFFVLLGEVAERIRAEQPDRARRLEVLRVWVVVVQSVAFLTVSLKIDAWNMFLVFVTVGIWATLTLAIFWIRPVES